MIVMRNLGACPVNAKLQPGMPMPKSLQGLGVAPPVPEILQADVPTTLRAPAGAPSSVSPQVSRRLQVGGVLTSASFAAAGLIASQQGKSELAAQLALASILAGAVVSISQLFMSEGY